ncbi:hypothetical protein OF83DRAFT_1173526 [Amylostereum chailletii]|nr:hypothetical protein OF83DRAFT_1173526 [Amylostereum chailletii]
MIVRAPHMLGYDNLNLVTSIFVEQRGAGTPDEVQSGTFAMVYPLFIRAGAIDHTRVQLAPILERLRNCPPLTFQDDLRLPSTKLLILRHELSITIIHILVRLCPGFSGHASSPALQHCPIRPLLDGHRTQCCYLCVLDIEEASRAGNLKLQDHIYLIDCEMTPEELSDHAILVAGNGLTCSRVRSGKDVRKRELNAWACRDIFQITIGLFHMGLNLIWALLCVHRGTLSEGASLTSLFVLLEKTRLGSPHPNYHTLLAALMQILDGLVLEAWRKVLRCTSLADFALQDPTADDLILLATQILNECATPAPGQPVDGHSPANDKVHYNTHLLIHDLLYVSSFLSGVSDGDFGHVELLYPHLAIMFRRAGGTNYASKIMHHILYLEHIWTPDYAYASELCYHQAMGVNLNAEHHICALKTLIGDKGATSDWEHIGNASACIDIIEHMKTEAGAMLGSEYAGTTHTTPEAVKDMSWRVAMKAREEGWLDFTPGRVGNQVVSAQTNILSEAAMKEGRTVDDAMFEVEELPMMDIGHESDDGGDMEDDEELPGEDM